MNQITAIVGADYEEYKPETLRGFTVSLFEDADIDEKRTFDTLEEADTYAFKVADTVYHSSTVDNFKQDSRKKPA